MIIIFLQKRGEETHLIDYVTANGSNYSMCGLIFSKDLTANTLAVDSSPNNVCRACMDIYERIVKNNNMRHFCTETFNDLHYQAQRLVNGTSSIEEKYWKISDKYSSIIKKAKDKVSPQKRHLKRRRGKSLNIGKKKA